MVIELLSNSAHLHILLNHVPTVGFGVGLALLLAAVISRSDDLKRASLAILFVVATVAIATYVTGNAAEAVLRGTGPDPVYQPQTHPYPHQVSPAAIREHEDAALGAFVFMEITGFFAWLTLWQSRRGARVAGWNIPLVLLLSVITFGLMAKAAEKGGEINHPEVTVGHEAAAAGADTGFARSVGAFVNGASGSTWVWATCETLHFVGLCMLFTVLLIVNLRMLGVAKALSLGAVYQLLPWGMLGFGLNLITGMMFFIGAPGQYVHNGTFFWKIVFVLVGGLNTTYFMLVEDVWTVRSGQDAPFGAKLAAVSAISSWVAVLFCGHMLPFLGNAF